MVHPDWGWRRRVFIKPTFCYECATRSAIFWAHRMTWNYMLRCNSISLILASLLTSRDYVADIVRLIK
jgi:hypothetical protein